MRGSTETGRLIYVMGPSGSGKDSLIDYVRNKLDQRGDDHIVVARRYVTRPPEFVGEKHYALSSACFLARLQAGDFALSWSANGLDYGIGGEIDVCLRTGRHVIVNGSRANFPLAIQRYPTALPILVAVDPVLLQARLLRRGRETADEIAGRVTRAKEFMIRHPAIQIIENNGDISSAGEAFWSLIQVLPDIQAKVT
jgi:ribose 1,5-bisphosphokinase